MVSFQHDILPLKNLIFRTALRIVLNRDEAEDIVQDTINALPEKQRTVLQLRDIEGKNYKEIASVLNLTESDVKVTLFRARSTLKEKILKKKSLYL